MQPTNQAPRTARPRPHSQHGGAPLPATPTRKIFNCIVDDAALVAGVKKSTRNGIRQWVKNGQIRLFVPLHALDQLSRQKGASNRHGEDVRDTLDWLDHATSKYPHVVTLQGAEETFAEWAEVEKFAVPRGLFSESDHVEAEQDNNGSVTGDVSDLKLASPSPKPKRSSSSLATASSRSLSVNSMESARSSISPVSPPTSPAKANTAEEPAAFPAESSSTSASVPNRLQPLFNYILWRIHQELDPVAALETFIFLCNDPLKVHAAKGFDVRCKRLEQLREAVGREDRELRNKLNVLSKEAGATGSGAETTVKEAAKKSPPKAPAAMLGSPTPTTAKVMDPDAFSRTVGQQQPGKSSPIAAAAAVPRSPRAAFVQPSRGAMNNRGPGAFRGGTRGGGRGGLVKGGAAAVTPPVTRGGFSAPRRGGGGGAAQLDGQIDPNSFERPRGGFAGRGGRKLWVPT